MGFQRGWVHLPWQALAECCVCVLVVQLSYEKVVKKALDKAEQEAKTNA